MRNPCAIRLRSAHITAVSVNADLSFQRRCTPPLIRSFMRSYDDATLLKTPPTMPAFSAALTSWKPACNKFRGLSRCREAVMKHDNKAGRCACWLLAVRASIDVDVLAEMRRLLGVLLRNAVPAGCRPARDASDAVV